MTHLYHIPAAFEIGILVQFYRNALLKSRDNTNRDVLALRVWNCVSYVRHRVQYRFPGYGAELGVCRVI